MKKNKTFLRLLLFSIAAISFLTFGKTSAQGAKHTHSYSGTRVAAYGKI